MVFCRFEVDYKDVSAEGIDKNAGSERSFLDLSDRPALRNEVDLFNRKSENKAFIFPTDYRRETLLGGVISEDIESAEDILTEFMNYFGMKPNGPVCIDEITIDEFNDLSDEAECARNLKRGRQFLKNMGIADVYSVIRRYSCTYGESLAAASSPEKLKGKIEKTTFAESMGREFGRIFAGKGKPDVYGHPCHYFLESAGSPESRDEACECLISALCSAGRLRSARYWYIDADTSDKLTKMMLDSMYSASIGATVVIRFSPSKYEENDGYASDNRRMVELFGRVIKKYQNDVLTVVCIPSDNPRIKAMFYEELGSINVVECCEGKTSGERAKKYLRLICAEKKVKPDKNLYASLDSDAEYLCEDLDKIFNEWYNRKLKTSFYPQYKDLEKAEVVAFRNKKEVGAALKRLNELVGLSEAKNVIKKALDYFTAQKLFKSRGIKTVRPSLSMVFTGNPGTCKTTVARLVAEIFRDSGILSAGRMIECGRADLVAKFVGWTAQNIKAKFAQARGSVLFIDEAYSLVDDRDGCFGDEAINTIVQEMENHRDDVLVIFAGYPDKMERFLEKNPGLRSRIAFHVHFNDYNPDELCEISDLIADQKGLVISDEARDKLHRMYEKISTESDFGNGRAARNVIEAAGMLMASRIVNCDFDNLTHEELTTILPEDIEEPEMKHTTVRRAVGF